MQDFLFESLALQRIELMARLVADSECGDADRELAINWIAELTRDLVSKVDEYGRKSPHFGGESGGGALQ
ncbi:hypothetical protein PEC730217_01500 [Pectobacterium carotovorum subsp. carotovorum]|uniref:hypothetical protein n=1 Tax=Pectobacterium TaxID=122277 RepID=UPI0004E605E3|nr:hypothetical protein [Pectobacterium brasiliense]KFF72100.1 hypothetical protein IW01_05640 [Pectobacterium brasiliense]GKW31370.1 hypothetical protein PEC730217_01500 [Pectobacterium carotovorum subsp. carotovorum]